MDVFELPKRLVEVFASHTRILKIADQRIRDKLEFALGAGADWPKLLLQLNSSSLLNGRYFHLDLPPADDRVTHSSR